MNGKRLKITLYLGLIILLISSFQSPLRSQVPDSVKVKYKNALKLLGQDNYELAIAEMQKIIQEHPDFSQVYRYLVEAYIFRNALERAQTYFETLLTTNSKNAYAYYALARIDFERKDYDQAIAKLKKSITLDPKFADAYSHRGGLPEVYRAKKDLDSAIQFFSALIATYPRNAYAHFGLARSYIRKYAWEKALTSLAQAIELNPEFTLAYHSMIYIFARTGKYDQALLQSENLLKIARKNDDSEMIAYAAMMIGSSYFLQGDYFRALQFLTDALKNAKAIGDKRREGACLNTIAAIYALSANFTKALKYFNEALLLARKTGTKIWEVQALTNLGNVFKDQGNYQQALKYYQQALDRANKNKFKYEETLALSNMAEVYQKKGDYQQAIKYQQQALRIAVETEDTAQQGFILRNLGTLNQELGNDFKALDLLAQARKIGLETQDIQIIWETEAGLGSYYEKQAKFRQAITHYANAIAIYDSVRNSIDIESLRNNFLEDKYQAYPSIVQLLAQDGN
ncbi:MAG: tetratricopeptide repeat protein, partial [bacterium]